MTKCNWVITPPNKKKLLQGTTLSQEQAKYDTKDRKEIVRCFNFSLLSTHMQRHVRALVKGVSNG